MKYQEQQLATFLIVKELATDYFRRLTLPLSASMLVALVLPWALFHGILQIPSDSFNSTNFYPGFIGLCASASLICSMTAQQGIRSWLYTRPVTTRFILAWLVGVPAVTAVGVHTAANLFVGELYGVSWPWVRPALVLFTVTLVTRYFHLRLLVPHSYHPFAFIVAYALLLYGWSQVHTVDGRFQVDRPFLLLELAAVAGICFVVTRNAYRLLVRARTDGEVIINSSGIDELQQLGAMTGTSARAPRFASMQDALKWISWQQGGAFSVFAAIVAALASVSIIGLQIADAPADLGPSKIIMGNGIINRIWVSDWVSEILNVAFVSLFLSSFGAGTFIGIMTTVGVQRPGDVKANLMSTFLSTKPITNKLLWRCIGRSIFRCSVITWVVACVIVCLAVSVVGLWSGTGDLFLSIAQRDAWRIGAAALASLLLIWTCASAGASIAFFGQDRAVAVSVIVAVCLALLVAFWGLSLPKVQARILSQNTFTLCGLAVLATTVFAYIAAFRKELIEWRHILTGVVVWIFVALLCLFSLSEWAIPYRCALAASSSLCVFALAAGPLGLETARHRR